MESESFGVDEKPGSTETSADPLGEEQEWHYSRENFDATLENSVSGVLDIEDVIKRHRRVRRSVTKKDTIEHVTKIMESIEEELDDLKRSQAVRDLREPESKLPGGAPRCLVLPMGGGVNCTKLVYQDPNEWRISRREIEQQIRDMRMQLETLKEIRRHLMVKKPHSVSENEAEEEGEEGEDAEEWRDSFGRSSKNKSHVAHPNHQKNHTTRHHFKKHEKTLILTSTALPATFSDTSATAAPPTSSSSSTTNQSTVGTSSTLPSRKSARRQKPKVENRADSDAEKSTRRRKIHNHKKNATVLTNSVHFDAAGVNATENSTTTTRAPSSAHRHHHFYATRTTSLPVPSTVDLRDFQRNSTPEEQDVTKITTTTLSPETIPMISTNPTTLSPTTEAATTTTTFSTPTTTTSRRIFPVPSLTTRKPIRILKNPTPSPLGPARIDVTILESPDRIHKQGNR